VKNDLFKTIKNLFVRDFQRLSEQRLHVVTKFAQKGVKLPTVGSKHSVVGQGTLLGVFGAGLFQHIAGFIPDGLKGYLGQRVDSVDRGRC
jgi:hypothetical protein